MIEDSRTIVDKLPPLGVSKMMADGNVSIPFFSKDMECVAYLIVVMYRTLEFDRVECEPSSLYIGGSVERRDETE